MIGNKRVRKDFEKDMIVTISSRVVEGDTYYCIVVNRVAGEATWSRADNYVKKNVDSVEFLQSVLGLYETDEDTLTCIQYTEDVKVKGLNVKGLKGIVKAEKVKALRNQACYYLNMNIS